MSLSSGTVMALQIGSGFFWTLVYLLIIKRGFEDRTYGMPLVALAANLSWEFIFSVRLPHRPPQLYVNYVWLLFDLVILVQTVRFGKQTLKDLVPEKWFYPTLGLSLVTAFGIVLTMSYEFQDWDGKYAAFGQNLMMSILFVIMLLRRKSLAGQSVYIAIFKMIGTVLPSFLFANLYPGTPLLYFLYVMIFVFDWLYIILLYFKHKELGINPWKRF